MGDYSGSVITGAIVAGIVGVMGAFYKYCLHSRCTSSCCGKVVSLKVDMSPTSVKPSVDIPVIPVGGTAPIVMPKGESGFKA